MTTLERCPHPHAWPAVECTGVRLTRSWFARVCLCGHPNVVHEHWRTALDCGMCDCLHYETARRRRASRQAVWLGCILICVTFWWPLIRAITGR